MKTRIIASFVTASVLLAGCGRKPDVPANSAASTAASAAQPALTAWQQGDQASAVRNFLETDWSARPLFAPGSALNLGEAQFIALSRAEQEAKSGELTAQLGALKQLGAAVAQAGRDAAAKGDTAQARKHFNSLQQCGAALASPDCLRLVQLVGPALKKIADTELAKIGP